MRRYETCLDVILNEERDYYESILLNSTAIIPYINCYREENCEECREIELKYANVLFGFKSCTCDKEKLERISQARYERGYIERFDFQKTIKDYLGNIDSTLDYLENFVASLRGYGIVFERQRKEFSLKINTLRNQVMHEGLPTVNFAQRYERYDMSTVCHSDFAGGVSYDTGYTEIEITFAEGGKTYTVERFIKSTYYPTKRQIESIIKELIDLMKK